MNKPRLANLAVALPSALIAASVAFLVMATFDVFRIWHLLRGVPIYAVMWVVAPMCGILVSRLVFGRSGPAWSTPEIGGNLAQVLLTALIAVLIAALVAFVVIEALLALDLDLAPNGMAGFTATLTFCVVLVAHLVPARRRSK